ncbi:MAG: TonB-dependent receptor, partial [Pseudomonadota bacterium]
MAGIWTRRRAAFVTSCAILALAAPVAAQDAAQDSENAEEQDERPGGTIIVTAERRATDLQDTPLSIIALNQEMVEAKGIEDLQDLARYTPNLSITPARGAGNNTANFVIRGIGGGGGATGERGVGLYIDGVFMPRTSGAILRVLDIDRIEVLRGPQGTLFGRNSTGGAIRIFSQQPTDEFEGYGKLTLGNIGRTDMIGMLNVPVTDTLSVRVQGAYLSQGGYVTRGTERLGSTSDSIGRFQARWEPSSNVRATLGLSYTASRANGTPFVMSEFDMRPGIEGFIQGNYADWINDAFKKAGQAPLAAYNDPRIVTGDPFKATDLCLMDDFDPDYGRACDQFSNDDYFQADLNLAIDLSDTLTVSSVTGYSDLKHTGLTDFQVLGTENRTDNVQSEVFYQELQLNAELFSGAVDLVVGGNYFHEESLSPNFNLTRRGTSVYPAAANGNGDAGLFRTAVSTIGQTATSYGAFASGTLHVTDRINLTGGVRRAWDEKNYNQERFPGGSPGTPDFTPAPGTTSTYVESSADFSAWDWRGTVDWQFTDDIMVYATASKAYKAGAFSYTVVSFTNANNATGPNQSLGIIPVPNEKVINYEAGLRMELLDGMVRLNPTVFRMDFTNRQAGAQVVCGQGALASIAPGSAQCPVGFLIQVVNQGDVRLEGVEIDGLIALSNDFYIDGSFAMFKPTLINPPPGNTNLFPDAPSPSFNISATWNTQIAAGDLSFNAGYAWLGKMETHPSSGTDSSYTLPSYGLVNARVQLAMEDYPVTFTLAANNLLDKTYAVYAQRFGGGFWDAGSGAGPAAPPRSALSEFRGRPREVSMTMRYDF